MEEGFQGQQDVGARKEDLIGKWCGLLVIAHLCYLGLSEGAFFPLTRGVFFMHMHSLLFISFYLYTQIYIFLDFIFTNQNDSVENLFY